MGVYIDSDMTEFEDYRTRAEAGDADAQFNLAVSYANGRGVEQDDVEALRLIRLAADQGHAASQCFLGARCATGEGVTQDDTEAVRWTRLAAEQGVSSAQYNLGLMYYEGEGVTKDDTEAAGWYRLAAEQGNGDAQFNLGVIYANGEAGGAPDYLQAHMWFNRAASRRTGEQRENAVNYRDLIAGRMTPTQIAEAQRLAREWDAAHPR